MKDDVGIQQDVLEELDWEASLNAADIAVTARDGIVRLGGTVETYAEKREAEKAALRVKGVRAVVDEITVSIPDHKRLGDTEIANAVVQAIRWNVFVPDDKIKVRVEKGWVTLEGHVEWHYQRERAEQVVRPLAGVRGVTNHIEVKPRLSPFQVRDRIRKALDRIAIEDADRITINIQGDIVTLGGTVSSWIERKEAKRAAWSAPGVKAVRDEMIVRPLMFA